MTRIFLAFAGILLLPELASAQVLDFNNNGAQVAFGAGAVVGSVGNFNNNSGSANALSGSTVYLYRNFSSAATATLGTGTGTWRLDGTTGAQTVDANGGALPTLVLNNPNGAGLLSNLGATALTLQDGYFSLNTSDLRVGSSITGVLAASRFILTNSTGFLRRPAAAGTQFPIGSAAGSYNPATLSAASGSPDFGARVASGVYTTNGGKSGPQKTTDVVDRHWELTSYGAAATPLTIALQWDVPQEMSGFTRSQSAVGFFTGTAPRYYNQAASFGAATAAGSSWQQQATYTTAGGMFIIGDRQSPLPVELVEFKAIRKGDAAHLTWRTASEKNNDYFGVEVSTDGRTFRQFARVTGQGSSSSPTSSEQLDPGLLGYGVRVVYYRLRQVDFDGTLAFSPVSAVQVDEGGPTVSLYPNPATGSATLDLHQLPAGTYQVTIHDITGRVVQTAAYEAGQGHTLDLRALAHGAYLVRVQGGAGFHKQLRLVVE